MKKRKSTPHLDKYKEFITNKHQMDCDGLCRVIFDIRDVCGFYEYNRLCDLHVLIEPTYPDLHELDNKGHHISYWGSDSSESKIYEFTPLRQNLLLLIAAMNNEL